MRKTIKELENQLEHAKKSRDDYYRNWQELEEKIKKDDRNKMHSMEEQTKQFISLTETLREIIRWQINPDTAKYPFQLEKTQRDEGRDRRF